jgi:filamentous hemagglutinin
MAMGNVKEFDWKSVAMSGVSAGINAGIGQLAQTGSLSAVFKDSMVARAMISSTLSQGIGVATGLQNSFSWRSVAAAGAGAYVGDKVGGFLKGQNLLNLGNDYMTGLARGTVSGFASGVTASVLRAGRVDVQQVAADAFGNALGSSLAEASSSTQNPYSLGNKFLQRGWGEAANAWSNRVDDAIALDPIDGGGYDPIGQSTYGLGELRSAGLNVPQGSRFWMQPGEDNGYTPRMGDTGPVNETTNSDIKNTVVIQGRRLSFLEKVGSYFADGYDAVKEFFSSPDYSQRSDYQLERMPYSDFSANLEKVRRGEQRGAIPYSMESVVSNVIGMGIKGGAAAAAFPYAVNAMATMGARQAYAVLGGSILTDTGLQVANNLDGSQRGWNPMQSAVSVGLPLVAVGAKPTAMWLASGLENGVSFGGFKIFDPNVSRMYAVPQGANSSGSATSAINRVGLRESLAVEAGIPRNIAENPSGVWGSSLDDLKQSFAMDGATVATKAPRASSSGNAQVFTVKNSATGIKEVQFSPASDVSEHIGQYYKLTYTDGSKVKIVDPNSYVPSFKPNGMPLYDKNTVYLNPQGQQVVFNPATNTWVKKQ